MRKLLQVAICSVLVGCQVPKNRSVDCVPGRGPTWGRIMEPIRKIKVSEVKRKNEEVKLVEKLLSLGWGVQQAKPKYVIAEKFISPEEAAIIFASDLPGEPERLKLQIHLIRWENGKWGIEGIVAEKPRRHIPVAVLSGLKAEKVAELIEDELDRAERVNTQASSQ